MYKLCRIDIKRSEEIKKELKAFIKILKKDKRIKEVYLHGSFARGDFNEGSDIDMVIVGDFKVESMIKSRNPFILSIIEGD